MKDNIILFDFDGVYKTQDFYEDYNHKWLNMQKIKGTNAYCDISAQNVMRDKLKNISLPELSFIGSGNYHYISLFLTEKIVEDFALVVFDNHSDMQKPIFDELLSCGSWVRTAYKNEIHLKQIVLVGTNESTLQSIDKFFKDKLTILPYSLIYNDANWHNRLREIINYPVYISVDKDVFSEDIVKTNWDQGRMNMQEFLTAFEEISSHHKVIGMDVCGEYSTVYTEPSKFLEASRRNNHINRKLLELGSKIIA